jgi:hypothetical protein
MRGGWVLGNNVTCRSQHYMLLRTAPGMSQVNSSQSGLIGLKQCAWSNLVHSIISAVIIYAQAVMPPGTMQVSMSIPVWC